jgi:hypothetical protein
MRKPAVYAALAAVLMMSTATAGECPDPHIVSGADLQIIQIALPEFTRRSVDISAYQFFVEEREDQYIVSAHNPDKFSKPGQLDVTVEISKADRKVTASYFLKRRASSPTSPVEGQ